MKETRENKEKYKIRIVKVGENWGFGVYLTTFFP